MMTKARVIKAFVQADPDPSKPHHRYGEGEHEMPSWIANKAICRGEIEVIEESPEDAALLAKLEAEEAAKAKAAKKAK
jgi:hypothetical protein